ncbi:MAG: tetratricopeptide repeat protein [Betaproteobacteria bacterium]
MRLHARGELDAAARLYETLIDGAPGDPRLLVQLGLVRLQQDRLDDAAALLDRVLAADPNAPEALAWRGEVLRRRHALAPAVAAFRAALARQPDLAPALFNLALAEVEAGNPVAARDAWQRFAAVRPTDLRVCRELGRLAFEQGDFADAAQWYARQFERKPDDADAAFRAGLAHERLARLDDAIAWFGKAAGLAPARANIRSAMGVASFNLGAHPQAIAHHRAALELDPGFAEAHSNLLMALHHADPAGHDALHAEHVAWVTHHASAEAMPRAAFGNDRDSARRLTIGYVSPRFSGGPLAHFFLPLQEAHDRDAFDVTCYATSDVADDATAAMRAHADRWRSVATLDDDALVAAIRADGIDILVDLVGHCPGQRLGVFARRGAPVQITWLDYVGTTGLPTMDWLVTDARHTPVGSPQRYTERLIRLPDTRLCYRPTPPLPALAASPAVARGVVTFGCFNRLAKLGPEVVETWSAILTRVPGARLVLKATAFAAEGTRATVRRRFERHGIDPARLDLRPYTAEAQMMHEYVEIDVALDPFPYNGCTTTCDALAMGVPVVTLEGTTLPGRHGVALLTAAGLGDDVTQSREAYIERAVALAGAGGGSATARAALRERFLASPVCDGPRFARAFEQACRDAWTDWCERGG